MQPFEQKTQYMYTQQTFTDNSDNLSYMHQIFFFFILDYIVLFLLTGRLQYNAKSEIFIIYWQYQNLKLKCQGNHNDDKAQK